MYLRDEGYHDRLPRALILLSPWVDLTMSCGSWDENAPYDVVPQPGKDGESFIDQGKSGFDHALNHLARRPPESRRMLFGTRRYQSLHHASLCISSFRRSQWPAADVDPSVSQKS